MDESGTADKETPTLFWRRSGLGTIHAGRPPNGLNQPVWALAKPLLCRLKPEPPKTDKNDCMKMTWRLSTMLIFTAACSAMAGDGQGTWNAWLASQATPKTREATVLSGDGKVQSVVATSEYDVRVKQVTVEEQKRDEHDVLRVVKQTRTTEVLDAFGGKLTTLEENTGIGGTLAPKQIVEEVKTPLRTVVTIQTRNEDGHLVVTKRTTRTQREDGTMVTEVETRSASGALVVTERTTER